MQQPTARRSKVPALGQGLFVLSLLLAALFVASPFIPRLVVSVGMLAAFVLVTATALMVTLVIVPLPRSPWSARAAQQVLVSLLISLGLTMLPGPAPLWVAPAVFVILIGGAESLSWTVMAGLCLLYTSDAADE